MDLIGPSALVNVEPDVARAMNAMAAEENISLFEAVEQAKERVRAERERIELSVRQLKLEYRRVEVSPFEMAKRIGALQTSDTYGERATVKQVDLLKKWGWNEADGMTKRQATAIIQKVIERREAGMCTVKQLNLLVSLGVEPHKARQMSFESASDRIGQLLGQTG
jgi:hypothetical protein